MNFLQIAESAVDSAMTKSLRGSLSEAKTTKQFAELNKETSASPCFASEAKQPSINQKIDCHDLQASLAMTKKHRISGNFLI
ncbi:hypothetical protein ACWIUD_10775 [Helicobacter sp. 23-1044]